jgi:hypothetical protein
MFDQDFCAYLEYELTKAFAYSTDQAIKGFWCDGILPPFSDDELLKKSVNDKREITTNAFIGKEGQENYKLTLKFGNKALSRYARNLDLKECIPDITNDNWYDIDPIKKIMIVHLL